MLFGHHFAAITGAGPLIGPVLAAQFGWAPGFMWLLGGCVLAGAVHDMITLWASTRRGGRSLAEIARIGNRPASPAPPPSSPSSSSWSSRSPASGIAVVNALAESAWGTFTIGATIPIAVFMGFYMFKWRKGHIKEATIIGVTLMFLGVVFGKNVAESAIGPYFVLSPHQITLALGIYAFVAADHCRCGCC